MKIPRIANSVGHMDDDLISEAAENNHKHNPWLKWGSVAACFAVLVIAGTIFLPPFLEGNVNPGGPGGKYKDYYTQNEGAIVWPWEYQTAYEKYNRIKVDGVEYFGKRREVSEEWLGSYIGAYTASGYDELTNKKYTADFEVYELQNLARNQFVAVKLEENYYVFQNAKYNPPATLGALMEEVDLSKVLELNRFSENGDGVDKKYYMLSSDDYIWSLLMECKDATFVKDEKWSAFKREYLSFSITSEPLGVYKKVLYITKDGYLWTNAFDWAYIYNIGEENAGKIIQYAKEHSEETVYESYTNAIAGKITEITNEYILVDDSILCENPEDGGTFKILLNDIRISRYVDYGMIHVGDTVQVTYEGEINEQNTNTISNAISISEAIISGGDVSIPE